MSEQQFTIQKPSDNDGFSKLECPHCGDEFKLYTDDLYDDSVIELFCPSCGLPSEVSEFLPQDVVEHAMTVAENEMKHMVNEFIKGLEKSFKGNKFMKVKAGKKLKMDEPRLLAENDDLEDYSFECCAKKGKVTTLAKASVSPYCPYCGVN